MLGLVSWLLPFVLAAEPEPLDGLVVQVWMDGKQLVRFDQAVPELLRWTPEQTRYGEDRRLVDALKTGTLNLAWGSTEGKWGRRARGLREAWGDGEREVRLVLLLARATPTLPAATRCVWGQGRASLSQLRVGPAGVQVELGWQGEGGDACDGLRSDPAARER